ncbi:hypothetical protein NVV30_23335, partial [Pseudomonas syringae]|uniref:hypothetical protein n=1 Tax=Pseudomonas syringae TaxID=317 RepID=UPI00215AFCFB
IDVFLRQGSRTGFVGVPCGRFLGSVRKVAALGDAALKTGLVRESDRNAHLQPVESNATPAVPRLFCLA